MNSHVVHGKKLDAFVTAGLTLRESEALLWVAEGKTKEETGMIMGCSTRTARAHIEHAKDKLHAANLPHLVALAFDKGVLSAAHVFMLAVAFLATLQSIPTMADDDHSQDLFRARTSRTARSGRRTRDRNDNFLQQGFIYWDEDAAELVFPSAEPALPDNAGGVVLSDHRWFLYARDLRRLELMMDNVATNFNARVVRIMGIWFALVTPEQRAAA